MNTSEVLWLELQHLEWRLRAWVDCPSRDAQVVLEDQLELLADLRDDLSGKELRYLDSKVARVRRLLDVTHLQRCHRKEVEQQTAPTTQPTTPQKKRSWVVFVGKLIFVITVCLPVIFFRNLREKLTKH